MSRPKRQAIKKIILKAGEESDKLKEGRLANQLRAIIAFEENSAEDIAKIFKISIRTYFRWIEKFSKAGLKGIMDRSKGHYREKLTLSQKEIIKDWILKGINSKKNKIHWTLKKIKIEVNKEFGVNISTTSLWKLMRKMGLVMRKPRPLDYKADIELQKALKKKSYKKINDFLEKENRKVFFFDEGRFGTQSTLMRVWAEKGKPLEVKYKIGYKSFYIYSSVPSKTGESFSLFLPEVNTEMMNLYLAEMTKAFPEKEIMLIMDQASWHKSKALKRFKNITIEYLPPYSPQLNPVEKLWWWMRKEITHNEVFETIEQLMNKLEKEIQNFNLEKYLKLCNCSYI